MPTASSVLAERFWPAVPEHIWDSIREEFTLPTAADLETHFQSVGDPEAMRRAVRVFLSGLLRLGTSPPLQPPVLQPFIAHTLALE